MTDGDLEWIQNAYPKSGPRRSGSRPSGLHRVSVLMVRPLVHVWTRGIVHAPYHSLTIALSAWLIVYLINQPQAMLLNGLHEERFQLKITAATVLVPTSAFSIWLTYMVGVSGPIWGTVDRSSVLRFDSRNDLSCTPPQIYDLLLPGNGTPTSNRTIS